MEEACEFGSTDTGAVTREEVRLASSHAGAEVVGDI